MKNALLTVAILLISFLYTNPLTAQDAVVPGLVRIDLTFENISINYSISGDDNRNSNLVLRYKEAGTTSFKDGAITMRAYPGLIIDGNTTTRNFHAGSALLLKPGTVYELEMSLTDPDGGSLLSSEMYRTKSIPQASATAKIQYVSAGNGVGNGTQLTPYLGLQAAADNAQAGDHFMVAPGDYEAFSLQTSGTSDKPICFISSTQHGAIIDGANTDRGIITLGEFDISLSQVIIDGFVIENGRWGIDAQNTQFVTIRNNIIQNVDYGFVNRRDNGSESDQYITNNLILGNTSWPQTGIPNERGVDIRGNNNVVSYNTIKYFGDGVATDGPPYEVSYSLDIHNNDIQSVVDDLIEVDGMISNSRVYANRCFNGRAGVSLAPVYGGPAYVFRNILFNLENSAFKMNRGPSGMVIVHNTSVSHGNALKSPDGWQNTYFRNNVLLATRYCFELYGLEPDSQDDWDYGAYYSTRAGTAGAEWFKWANVRYGQVADLHASNLLEVNAIEIALSDFTDASLPDVYPTEYEASQRNLSPVQNAALIDNGAVLSNLNNAFVSDGSPDRGALEYGEADQQYGHLFGTSSIVNTTNLKLAIYPNPFANYVILDGDFTQLNIQIFNATGILVTALNHVKTSTKINLSHLPSGSYFINAFYGEKSLPVTYQIFKK